MLAAGFAQRFGGEKLLARLPNGVPVWAQTLTRIMAVLPRVVVITRPELVPVLHAAIAEAETSSAGAAVLAGPAHKPAATKAAAVLASPAHKPAAAKAESAALANQATSAAAVAATTARAASPGRPVIFGCATAAQGLAASLAFGVEQVADWEGALICLADMPFVHSATYAALAARVTATRIVVPVQAGQRGNPVAFGARFFPGPDPTPRRPRGPRRSPGPR